MNRYRVTKTISLSATQDVKAKDIATAQEKADIPLHFTSISAGPGKSDLIVEQRESLQAELIEGNEPSV